MGNTNNNEEINNYLSMPENYKVALELIESISEIDKKFKDAFWEEVTQKLKDKIKNEEYDVIITTKYDDGKKCEWFQINKQDWTFYFISTDKEDIGIHKTDYDEKLLIPYKEKIKEIIENTKELGGFRNLGWPCWKTFSNYKFLSKQDKLKIIPTQRDYTTDECVNLIFDYIKLLYKTCDLINKNLSESYSENILDA